MLIGELADEVGVNPKTIRYYESIGLLPEPDRTDAGYRLYGQDDIDRVAFIRRAQQLDLTLDEIREIIELRESHRRPCGYVIAVASTRIDELDRRIEEIRRARDELHTLLQRARELPRERGGYCGLIEHHEASASELGDVAAGIRHDATTGR